MAVFGPSSLPAPSTGYKDYSGLLGPLLNQGQEPFSGGQGNLINAFRQAQANATGQLPGGFDTGVIGNSSVPSLGNSPQGVPARPSLAPPEGGGGQGGNPTASVTGQGGLPGGFFGASVSPSMTGLQGGPLSFSLSPLGTLGLGLNMGSPAQSSLANMGGRAGLSALGIPSSISLLGALAQAVPALGPLAALAGFAGAPFAGIGLAHSIASGMPTSVTNMQSQLATPNPETMLTPAQAMQIAQFGPLAFMGPQYGGPQQAHGVPGSFQGPQGAGYGLSMSNPSVAQGFAANLANSPMAQAIAALMGYTGRGVDTSPAAVSDPVAEGFTAAEAAATGQGTDTGAPAGPGPSATGQGESGPGGAGAPGEGGGAGAGAGDGGAGDGGDGGDF